MKCPQCQQENAPGAKFCNACGAGLQLICPTCAHPNAPGSRFCNECGQPLAVAAGPAPAPKFVSPQAYTPEHLAEKILTSRSALEGERKQVTVLFADLKGSMELLAERDPEEARKLLDPVLERMMEAVHRYEGTVNQVMGDGIMALFGAPLAHEDHAARACYAALRMQLSVKRYADEVHRTLGVPLHIRVGLNSGEVVVRSIGSDLRMDYTAVGQTTHLAARMEQMAMPGSILMPADTLKLAEGYVQVKALGHRPVKGLDAPVDVYQVTGAGPVRTRLQAAATRGFSRFVGRDAEVEQLRRALENAQDGRGQVVALVGEPGVGKSRLFYEFSRSHRTEGWLILESSSASYGKAVPYLPVMQVLKSYFHIEDRDNPQRVRERVAGKVLTLDDRLKDAIAPILSLLDVLPEGDPFRSLGLPVRRGRTLGALKQLLLRESQRQPLCLVLEDLHWIDAESQATLDRLVEGLPANRILLLINYRPEYEDRWASKTYHIRLRVDPLPPESSDELLDALLGEAPSLDRVKALVKERSGGTPLFLEELVWSLVETGALIGERGAYRLAREVPVLQVPATVEALLAARIDRLPGPEKQLLQCAAVIGKDVPLSLLEATVNMREEDVGSCLARLQAAEFLYEARLFPESEYTFKHALTHEVAYRSVLHERRRMLHRRVGDAIEKRYADRLSEFSEALAAHFERAEAWAPAASYCLKAAERARERYAYATASSFCSHALEIMESAAVGGDEQVHALILLGDLSGLLDDLDRANASYERALAGSADPAQRRWIQNKCHRPHTVVRDGAKIAFYEHGSGDQTIVMTNPFYGLATFQPVGERLCQEFRIITIDSRGSGASDPLTRPYPLRQHMEDVRAVIDAAGGGPIVGVGISRGGNLLVQLAAAYPSLVHKLVFVGTSLSWERPEARMAQEFVRKGDIEGAVRFWFSMVYPEPGTENLADQFVATRLRLPQDTILSFFDPDPEYDITPLLPDVLVPTLVTRGTIDRASPIQDAHFLVEHIPNALFYAFEGKGHVPVFTATSEFCEVLRSFVRTGRVPKPVGPDS